MAKADIWMPFYVADYLADTMHLSAAEHGGYLMLILHYWRTGPIPNAPERLANISRLGNAWSNASSTLLAFFEQEDGMLIHRRIDREKQEALSNKDRNEARAKAGAAKRWLNHTQSNAQSNAQAMPESCPSPSPSPSPSLKTPPPKPPASTSGFAEFWSAYPKKKSKGDAEKVWKRIKPDLRTVLSAIERAKTSADWLKEQGQFIPHPATWLNAKGWEDEITPASSVSSCGKPWFLSQAGIEQEAERRSIIRDDTELFPYFKARVYQAAGITEDMIRRAQADVVAA